MRTQRTKRPSVLLLVAACGLGFVADNRAIGRDSQCESGCTECSSNSYDCENECPHRPVPNYVYKTLDTVAGGIEKLLGLDKLNCGGACDSGGCDEAIYDDGCDALTLETLSFPNPPRHIHPRQPSDPTPAYDSEFIPTVPNQIHDDRWQAEPPSRMEMQMGEPRVIEPAVIDPQIQQQRPFSNPFQDDARVRTKRQVRRTIHERPKTRSTRKLPTKQNPKYRYSRTHSSSNRSASKRSASNQSVRTVR